MTEATRKGDGAAGKPIRLALVQMACGTDTNANMEEADRRVRAAAADGARLVVLPELYRSPYFCQRQDPAAFDLAEPIPGPTTARLGAAARETGAWVIASVFERRARGLYHNTAALLAPDGTAALYRKTHIPHDPQFEEKYYFAPGDTGFRVFDLGPLRVGVLICWDQWFPEAARLCALAGADLIVYPTAIGWLPEEQAAEGAAQHEAWRTVQRGHAIANGCYVAAVNRVGREPGPGADRAIDFWGGSFVCDPMGILLAEAGAAPETLVADLDPGRIETVRRIWPFLRDRRPETYAGLLRMYGDGRDAGPAGRP